MLRDSARVSDALVRMGVALSASGKWCVKSRILPLIIVAMISGCVGTPEQHCLVEASIAEISRADDLVKGYWAKVRGETKKTAFSETYYIVDTTSCSGIVTMNYAPKTFEMSGEIIVGSRVRYTVDIEKQTVVEIYLD
jgi:hypothetical protein